MIKLFVGGFSLDITEMELVQAFDPYARVVTIKIVRDKKTRVCKGYAFLEVATQEDAENAVKELDGAPIGDRYLTVKITADEPVKKRPASSFQRRPPQQSNYRREERRPSSGAPTGDSAGSSSSATPGLRPRRPRK
ncbi:RNA recognition motif domain-containing protein [Mucilaginibacter pedocola]|uniref:RRM domain-containing protein n=1 Tax=Mucilaginibacter pedocola TaxID=1792845 RepID=A0A1S9P6D7_9SPHI|nr:RNA-binding protein [Mucilaginibacter pedocola]OOQ56512.1 hypothetical protein BC343_18895 [Mucilaginibacter pedocola]